MLVVATVMAFAGLFALPFVMLAIEERLDRAAATTPPPALIVVPEPGQVVLGQAAPDQTAPGPEQAAA